MSFICEMCGLSSEKHERQNKETIKYRPKSYYTMCLCKLVKKSHSSKKPSKFVTMFLYEPDLTLVKKLKEDKWKVVSEKRTTGEEIEEERNLCENCYNIVRNDNE